MESQRVTRYYALDGVRAFSMLLGVFLHASVPYMQVAFPWAVVDESRSVSLTLIIYAIHSFRMPAFFLIAGFFARLVYLRGGLGTFVRHRSQRILLPLVAAWLVLHPVMRALWTWSFVRTRPGAETSDLLGALAAALSPAFLVQGVGLMHLWFLYYLLLLYVAFLAVRWVLMHWDRHGTRIRRLDGYFSRVVGSSGAALALALPTLCVLMMMQGWGVDFVARSVVPRPAHILFYGAFFVFGWMLHRNPRLLASLRTRWSLHFGVATLLLVPLFWQLYVVHTLQHPTGPWFRLAYFLMYGCLSWSFVLGLLGAFQRFFDRPSGSWRYLADASYWIYLVHLPLVVFVAIVLRDVPIGWYLKLPVVLLVSTPLLLSSYHLLVRSTWIGVMLNGRRLPL